MTKALRLTQQEYDAAAERAENSLRAVAFSYDEESRTICLQLDNETSVIFPLSMLPALKNVDPTDSKRAFCLGRNGALVG